MLSLSHSIDMRMEDLLSAMKRTEAMKLDGVPIALAFDDKGNEGLIGTSAGSIWFMDWSERLSVRICAGHIPRADSAFLRTKYYPGPGEGPPKHMLASSTADRVVKLWNAETYDLLLQIAINNEGSLSIAFHPFKQMCACSFTDGYLRFFDLLSASSMGRCKMYEKDMVVDMGFFPNGTHLLTATKAGLLDLIAILSFQPISLKISTVLNTQMSIASMQISMIEPYAKIGICSENGRMSVLTRKKLAATNYENFSLEETPKYSFLDTFNLGKYEANGFKEELVADKSLNQYYAAQSQLIPTSNTIEGRRVLGGFSNTEAGIVLCIEAGSTNLYIRNYTLHQVLRRVVVEAPVLALDISATKSRILITTEDGRLKVQDYADRTEKEQIEIQLEPYHSIQQAIFCSNNRVAVMGGSEITIYSIDS